MRTYKTIAAPVLGLVALGACSSGPTSDPSDPSDTAGHNHVTTGIVLEATPDCASRPSDAFTGDALRLEGDDLVFGARFGGGCGQHTFTACWDGSFLESHPVQARLRVLHDGHGDTCEALLSEQVRVPLGPLAAAYLAGYGGDSGRVFVSIQDVPGSVDYVF